MKVQTHTHSDRCYTCRAEAARKRVRFWQDITDFAGMALAVGILVALSLLFG